jgi:hypothetical protein
LDALSAHHRLSLARPDETNGSLNSLIFRRRSANPNPFFHLVPIGTEKLPPGAAALTRDISDALVMPMRWENVLHPLRAGALRPELAEPLLRLLPFQELWALAKHLVGNPADLALLQSAMPENPWFSGRFPRLAAWINEREQPARQPVAEAQRSVSWLKALLPFGHAGSSADCTAKELTPAINAGDAADLPGSDGTLAHRPDIGLFLTAMARAQTGPRLSACILACARNEGPYLLDWIAYHRSIGFDHIFLYTNDNTDGSDQLLSILSREGVITWIRNESAPGTLPQFRAYAHALSVMPEILDYQWTLISDLDEYFAFDTNKFFSVRDFLEWQELQRADAVALPWLIHVARPGDTWHNADVVKRMPMREATVNCHIKTIFRTHMMWSSNPHHPDAIPGMRMQFLAETGLLHNPLPPDYSPSLSHNPVAGNAWIAHYIFRTAPEALQKILRGKGDTGYRTVDKAAMRGMMKTFIRLATITPLVQDLRTARCASQMVAELARLRRIDGVTFSEATIKHRFVMEMGRACRQLLAEPVEMDEPGACLEFRAIIREHIDHRAAA